MLSNQALWYLRGLKKSNVLHTGIVGHSDPELSAMLELVNNGLCVIDINIMTGRKQYRITPKGMEYKENE